MREQPDPNGIYAVDRLPWSWSYLRHPVTLLLWLACALLSAFLNAGRPRGRHGVPVATAAPSSRPSVLRIQEPPGHAARRDDRDDEARAA
jgi:hypothetical protein